MRTLLILALAGLPSMAATSDAQVTKRKPGCCGEARPRLLAKTAAQNVGVKGRTPMTKGTQSGCCSQMKPTKSATSALTGPTNGTATPSSAKACCCGGARSGTLAKTAAKNVVEKEGTPVTKGTQRGCCSQMKPTKSATSALTEPTNGTAASSLAKPGCSGNAMQMRMILLEVKGLDQKETAASVKAVLKGMQGARRVTVDAENGAVRFL